MAVFGYRVRRGSGRQRGYKEWRDAGGSLTVQCMR